MSNHIPPTQLWLGNHDILQNKIQDFLQNILCKNNTCKTCATCRQIAQQQHHAVMWLHPEKNYTLEDLKPISQTISFALNKDQQFFFILEKADFLTSVCANSLLKSIEEPPQGYYFILLAERQDAILPTIRSRAVTTSLYTKKYHASDHPLFDYFSSTNYSDPSQFLKTLDSSKINEKESIELLDSLIIFWADAIKRTTIQGKETKKYEQVFVLLKKALEQSPMPGSSKLFWKNLFLQIKGS